MCIFFFFYKGVGIPAHLLDSVCHIYVRDNEMAERLQVPGTGLGLSIASSLVRKMGGELTFHSAVGLGTDFYVSRIIFKRSLYYVFVFLFFLHLCFAELMEGTWM